MICDKCNSYVADGVLFCPHCDHDLADEIRTAEKTVSGSWAVRFDTDIPPQLEGSFVLFPNETVQDIWRTSHGVGGNISRSGYLIATNQRLIFSREQYHRADKSWGCTSEVVVLYERILSISVINTTMTITIQRTGQTETHAFLFLKGFDLTRWKAMRPASPEMVRHSLNDHIHKRLQQINEEQKTKQIEYVLDFASLKSEVEKGGFIVQTIKCPKCGSPLDIPESGHSTICHYCGNSFMAEDIFEKMREVLVGQQLEKRYDAGMEFRGAGLQLPPRLRGSVILGPEEFICNIWHAGIRLKSEIDRSIRIESGYIIGTDRRIIFLVEQGVFNKAYRTEVIVPYEKVRGISTTMGLSFHQTITIGVEHNGQIRDYVFRHLKDMDPQRFVTTRSASPSEVQHSLNKKIEIRLRKVLEKEKKDRVKLVLDFSFLRAEIEKGGFIVQTIKCPNCGAGLGLPESGNSTTCEYCNSPVLAEDLFEKMKDLVGTS